MFQLLLDSSNKYLAVGLAKDNKIVDTIFYDAWQRQSEVMVTEIDNILSRNNVNKEELDSIVVGIGPGSYTGVRIAITIAKTIAYSLNIKVYQISSLSLLKGDKPTICIYNARSGRSYWAVYSDSECIVKDTVSENTELLKYIDEHKDYLVSGDVAHLKLESIKYNIFSNFIKAIKPENEVKNIFLLNPMYLKDLLK